MSCLRLARLILCGVGAWLALTVASLPARADVATDTSLAGLAARIDAHIRQPAFAQASWGIQVVSIDSGRTLYSHDADKLFVPASTAKLYTAALALDAFGADYRIPTSLFATAKPDRDGTLRGDLILIGYGDPTLGTDARKDWADQLATALRKTGTRSVRGKLIADSTWFAAPLYGSGWEAADLQTWYGAPASALAVNENVINVEVRPAPHPGNLARIRIEPAGAVMRIDNSLRTDAAPARTDINLFQAPGDDTLHAFGSIASNAMAQHYRRAMPDPARFAGEQLRAALQRQGVSVSGETLSLYWPERNAALGEKSVQRIADIHSAPLAEIVGHGLKVSQNLYLQNLLLMVGAKAAVEERESGKAEGGFVTTEAHGLRALRAYLKRIGVNADAVLVEDGPGLSRRDLTSPAALTALLVHLADQPEAAAFRIGLPEAGVDGSLTGRMRNSAAEGRIHAKTGSMAFTYALSGYVVSAAGERLAFTLMLNNYRRPPGSGRSSAALDAIAIQLAELSERSDKAGAAAP